MMLRKPGGHEVKGTRPDVAIRKQMQEASVASPLRNQEGEFGASAYIELCMGVIQEHMVCYSTRDPSARKRHLLPLIVT